MTATASGHQEALVGWTDMRMPQPRKTAINNHTNTALKKFMARDISGRESSGKSALQDGAARQANGAT